MRETPVRRVGFRLLVERTLPRILDAQRGGDDEHLAQRLLVATLDDHAADRRIGWQARQFAAEFREFLLVVGRGVPAEPRLTRPVRHSLGGGGRVRPTFRNQCAQFLQQPIAGANTFHRRRIEKREFFNVAETERLHAQDDVREIAALDFRLRVARAVVEILLRVEADAHAVAHAAATALALVGAALRDGLDGQPPRAALRRVAAQPREPGVDHEADAGNRQRGLGNVRRDDDLALLRRREHALLFRVRQPAKQWHDLDLPELAPVEQVADFADIALRRQEHQHVALRALLQHALDRLDRRVDVGEIVRTFLSVGRTRWVRRFLLRTTRRVVPTHFLERRIDDLDRIHAARHLDDGRVVERLGERLGVDRRRGDDDLQFGPAQPQPPQMAEDEIDVERTLVRLVDDDRVVFAEERIVLQLGEQHAVGHELDDRVARRLVGEPDFAADLAAERHVQLLGHAPRHRRRRHAPGLRAGDLAAVAATRRETHLRKLRRLARARLAREHQHLMLLQQTDDLVRARADRQLGRELDPEGPGFLETGRHREDLDSLSLRS